MVIFAGLKVRRLLGQYYIKMRKIIIISLLSLATILSCKRQERVEGIVSSQEYASFFDVLQNDSLTGIVVISPDSNHADTMWFAAPMERLVCMSSSHVAALSAIGAGSVIKAVSGLRYISDSRIKSGDVKDVGYDAALDYEAILALDPDLLVTYAVIGAEPAYVAKLRSLGVRTLVLHDHLEQHPLARAEYIRLFGVLTGRRQIADSVYAEVRDRYQELARNTDRARTAKVLINIPYGDAWYVPGQDGYMSRLVADAGGQILGAAEGTSASSVISLEQAYEYSLETDVWLNPGSCRSRGELAQTHHMFPRFGPLAKNLLIYNNIRCVNEGGGNDFWERGAVRPDLILQDLIYIFDSVQGKAKEDSPQENLLFYVKL